MTSELKLFRGNSLCLAPWVVTASVVEGVAVNHLVPGSCCSRARCYTLSLESGYTSYSSYPPLWHTPERQTETALSGLVSVFHLTHHHIT